MKWLPLLLALLPGLARAGSYLDLGPQTTAIEDVTNGGDEDRNDVVFRWAAQCDRNSSNLTVRQVIHLAGVAAGAQYTNALWLQLPATTSSVSITRDGVGATRTPDGNGKVVLYDDFRNAFVNGPINGFINTEPGGTVYAGKETEVILNFATPQGFGGGCPTPAFELHRAGVVIDASSKARNRPLYATMNATWQVPAERIATGTAYTRFLDWAVDIADGTCDTECVSPMWYEDSAAIVTAKVVARPSLATTAPLASFATCGNGIDAVSNPAICSTAIAEPDGLVAFVSSTGVYGGSLGTGGTSFDTFAKAADHCQTLAEAAGLGGTFVGWVSDSTQNAPDQFPIGSGPWYRLDGALIANDATDLTDGAIAVPLDITQTQAVYDGPVLTGTSADGTVAGNTCGDWKVTGSVGLQGNSAQTGAQWTSAIAAGGCNVQTPIYCFELPSRKMIATTKGVYTATQVGGLAGADAICQQEAATNGLGGTWKAWLSDSSESAAGRLRQWNFGYEDALGNTIANSWALLTDGTLDHAVSYAMDGTSISSISSAGAVWTGTNTDGTAVGGNCSDWTGTSGRGHVGFWSLSNAIWTSNASEYSCTSSYHLYCVEQ